MRYSMMRIIPAEIAKTGISVVDEMILQMHLSNATNGRTIKKGIMATVYPTGRKADQVRTPLRKPVENEYRILVNNTCAYIIQGIDPEDTRGLAVNCYLENRSKGTLNFVWSDVTIDGRPAKTAYEGYTTKQRLHRSWFRKRSFLIHGNDTLSCPDISRLFSARRSLLTKTCTLAHIKSFGPDCSARGTQMLSICILRGLNSFLMEKLFFDVKMENLFLWKEISQGISF